MSLNKIHPNLIIFHSYYKHFDNFLKKRKIQTSIAFSKRHTLQKKSPASQIRTGDIAVTARVRQQAHEQTTAAHSIQAELRRDNRIHLSRMALICTIVLILFVAIV
jgi:hypothetical protein